MQVRPCMIVMLQLYQLEILYMAHDEPGHQSICKVLARIQERHTWPGIKRDVAYHIKQCLLCQHTKHHVGKACYALQSINSSNLMNQVQFDNLKLCKATSPNNVLLVIRHNFSKLAEAIPCAHDECDAQTTAKIILNQWFSRHGTPASMQSDNATNFTSELTQELMKASRVTKLTFTPARPRGNGLVERQNRTLLTLLLVYTNRKMLDWMSTTTESWVPAILLDTQHSDFQRTCSSMDLKHPSHSHSFTRHSHRENLTLRRKL